MFRRVAAHVAQPSCEYGESVEQWAAKFHTLMERLEFLPNSPTLMNAGIRGGQLAACFVLPMEDDLERFFRNTQDGRPDSSDWRRHWLLIQQAASS